MARRSLIVVGIWSDVAGGDGAGRYSLPLCASKQDTRPSNRYTAPSFLPAMTRIMNHVIEFIGNHWWLVGIWGAFLAALLWDNSRRSGGSVSAAMATTLINKQDAVVVDIRDKKDFSTGHLANALNIPFSNFAQRMNELDQYKSRPIILVCKTGTTVSVAARMLNEKGFNTLRLSGGMMEWNAQNLPVVRK
ncbi:rhodanese-like domain-containing protein [Oceanospirillaceae bacterium G-43]|uniref:Rhodanese-like domain-containing protein n=2 Tax=Parathalassolituus penaei TaxID=2997323 RepID=A0A9X3ECI4_9GAMM|nr:rhodanese-like domain-containing protein [Parathalassolituus penaei]